MKNTNWRGYGELIGVTAIVGSLFFVGLQLMQSQDIVLSEMDVSLNANHIELTAVIADNANIWIRGNAGSELGDSELAIYSRLIDGVAGRHDSSWRRNMRFGREDVAAVNAAEFATFLHLNPGAKRVWLTTAEIRHESFKVIGLRVSAGGGLFSRAVREDLDKLDKARD